MRWFSKQYFQRLKLRIYIFSLKVNRVSITLPLHCNPGLFKGDLQRFTMDSHGWIGEYSVISIGSVGSTPGELKIGKWFYMNSFSIIDCHYQINIGDRVQIGPHCYIGDFDHGISVNLAASSHRGNKTTGTINIGDNVWIGSGVIILKSVNIGTNAVIGAGSIITKDVPANTVVVGSPQRVVKTIF